MTLLWLLCNDHIASLDAAPFYNISESDLSRFEARGSVNIVVTRGVDYFQVNYILEMGKYRECVTIRFTLKNMKN